MCATIILACFAIGSDLILPQLLKIALDSHITVSAQKLSFNNFSALPKVLLNEQKDLLVPTSNKNTFFIINEDLKAIPEDDLEILRERSFLSPEKYYYTERNLEIENIAQNNKELIFVTEKKVFITYENLKKLKKDEVRIIREKDFKGVVKITFYFICILVASFLFTFLQIFIVEFACQKIMHEIRIDIFKHIQSRSHAFFTSNPVGRLVTRATNDVQNLHEMFNAVFANILKDILLIFGIMGVLLWVNWKLALVCFSLIPVLIIASTFFSIQSRKAFRLVRIKIAAMNAKVQENITGIAVVKAFCREKINISSFNKLNNENYLANMKQTIIFAVFNPVVDGTRLFVTALIIWYGGGEALQDKITIGTLVLFLYYMRMFFRPIQDLAEKYNIIQSAFASLERIYLLMNNNERIDEPNNPLESETNDGKIEFKNVSFRYNKDEPVLENISFTVEPGQTVAIVGLTGTGKSTVINLIERFYDIKSGQILIDGVDIQKRKKSFL